jgi:hypothetical protein
MMHSNGKIQSILDKPLPKTKLDIEYEIVDWKLKIKQYYNISPIWLIRLNLMENIAYEQEDKIKYNLYLLEIIPSNFDMYQHLAFLKRIAYRFGKKKLEEFFHKKQMIQ